MDAGTLSRFAVLSVTRPTEFYDRLVNLRERQRPVPYVPPIPDSHDGLQAVHDLLGIPDHDCSARIQRVRADILELLVGEHHNDGSPFLGAMVAAVSYHTKPQKIVETGVARGITAAHILSTLTENSQGHLWSIDLPPLRPDWYRQSRSAVAPRLYPRWTFIRGATKRHLPKLLSKLGTIDIFIHDSGHTRPNMLREMRTAWSHIRPGGWLFCDDIYSNDAFETVSGEFGCPSVIVKDDSTGDLIGIIAKR